MDNLRYMISNLYIYNYQNKDNLKMNKSPLNQKPDESIFKDENYPKSYKDVYLSQVNNRKNYENNKVNNYKRIDNYNQKYIAIKHSNFLKNEVNYVIKNKELVKEQEHLMKQLKLQKENEALKLLLSYKNRNDGVRSKLYDYEIKQKQNKKNMLNKLKKKERYYSSQKPRKMPNYYENFNDNNDYVNELNEYLNRHNTVGKKVKLPKVHIKSTSSPYLEGLPILHKDYGKKPEYLEKRKQEMQEEKVQEVLDEKKKRLPSGYRILSEKERLERLIALKIEERKLEDEIYLFPIARLSKKQLERKEYIEKRLNNIEEKKNKLIGYKEVVVKEDE